MRSLLLLTIFISTPLHLPAFAQSPVDLPERFEDEGAPKKISFEEAVAIALEKSFDVQRASVDVLSAKTDQLKTFAQMGPTFGLKYLDTTNDKEISVPFGGANILIQPLRTQQTSVALGLNLTAVVAGIAKVLSQGSTVSMSQKAKELASIETAFGVAQIYRLAQQAQLGLEVARSRVKTVAKQQRDAVSLFAYGKISKANKLEIDFNANNSELGMIVAENEWLNANATLKKILHIEREGTLELDKMKNLDETHVPEPPSPMEALQEAVLNRKDLELANLKASSLQEGRWLNLASYLPLVSVNSNWRWNGDSISSFNVQNSQNLTLDATWQFWDNGAALLDFRATHLQARKAKIDAMEKTVDVRIDVEKALRSLRLAKETLRARDIGLAQAIEVYRGIEARFGLGSISVTDLLFAENILNQAKLDHLAATVGIDIANMNLQKALGRKRPIPL